MAVTATGFLTDAEIKSLVAISLSKLEADIDADLWDTAIEFWNVGTYNQIVNHWVGKGYSLADVTSWNAGKVFQQNLALYSVLVKQNVSDDRISAWQTELEYWRTELKEQDKLVAGGVLAEAADDTELYEIHTRGH